MKKCKNCKAEFTPIRFNQKYCLDEPCIKVWVNSQKEKEWKTRNNGNKTTKRDGNFTQNFTQVKNKP